MCLLSYSHTPFNTVYDCGTRMRPTFELNSKADRFLEIKTITR